MIQILNGHKSVEGVSPTEKGMTKNGWSNFVLLNIGHIHLVVEGQGPGPTHQEGTNY